VSAGAGGAPAAPPLPALDGRLVAEATRAGTAWPERVLQFGEGNFLRAFVDWMLQRMNDAGVFGGRAVVVQPIPTGAAERLTAQDGHYTVILRGLVEGRIEESRELVSVISRAVDPHRDFDAFLACAAERALRFVVSNTTEAGIRRDPGDRPDARPAPSFPGKLTQLLLARFRAWGGDPATGLVMLPCELIEDNGAALRTPGRCKRRRLRDRTNRSERIERLVRDNDARARVGGERAQPTRKSARSLTAVIAGRPR